jgi:hypothetical protein
LVFECSFLVVLVVHGGIAHFFGSSWGNKVNTPYFYF